MYLYWAREYVHVVPSRKSVRKLQRKASEKEKHNGNFKIQSLTCLYLLNNHYGKANTCALHITDKQI